MELSPDCGRRSPLESFGILLIIRLTGELVNCHKSSGTEDPGGASVDSQSCIRRLFCFQLFGYLVFLLDWNVLDLTLVESSLLASRFQSVSSVGGFFVLWYGGVEVVWCGVGARLWRHLHKILHTQHATCNYLRQGGSEIDAHINFQV